MMSSSGSSEGDRVSAIVELAARLLHPEEAALHIKLCEEDVAAAAGGERVTGQHGVLIEVAAHKGGAMIIGYQPPRQ